MVDERGIVAPARPVCTDYAIDPDDAKMLAGASLLPADIRTLILRKIGADRGHEAVVELFAQFIGLSNSVAANCREMTEEHLTIAGAVHPDRTPDINMPTVFSALMGVLLAEGVDEAGTCRGCAFRRGSVANQSPSTTTDADWCLEGDDRFMCHEEFNEAGDPTRKCVGFSRAINSRRNRGIRC